MSDVKISALPAAASISSTDVAPIVTAGVTSKVTAQAIVNAPLAANVAGTNPTLIGPATSANSTRFPNTQVVVSSTAAGIQQNESHNIGVMAEGVANSSNTSIYGVGVYGVGYTAGATRSGGVIGEGHVSASADTGSAIGVRGYANDTHSGGLNIGVLGEASGSSTGNYGFYGNIPSGTGRYNLYMGGTADNYLAGSLGIGSANLTGWNLRVDANITGSTASASIGVTGAVQSNVTSDARYFRTSASTAAATFTLGQLSHFYVSQSTIGAGSVVSNQFGFHAESTLTGATNNYGFYGNIASGTGRYNLYMAGTAQNVLLGDLGVGSNPFSDGSSVFRVGASRYTGASGGAAIYCDTNVPATNTGNFALYTAKGVTTAGGGLTSLYSYIASQGTFGSTVTNQCGFIVDSTNTGATNNYGFYGNIPSGTGRYNLYMSGTADNWFSGNVRIGGAGGLGYTTGSGGAVTQATSRTTGVTLNKTNGAITLVSAAGTTAYQSFTVTNSTVVATDTIIINQQSGTDIYEVFITAVAAGSFRVTFATTGGTTTEQPVFNFSVIKAVTA